MTTIPVRFEGLSLPVSDLDRSVAFYEQMGFEMEQRHGNAFAMMRLGQGTLGLMNARLPEATSSRTMTPEQRATIQVELTTDDLDALYARLSAAGIAFPLPPEDKAWERRMQCLDPDGYTVEFAQGLRGHNATVGSAGGARANLPDAVAESDAES